MSSVARAIAGRGRIELSLTSCRAWVDRIIAGLAHQTPMRRMPFALLRPRRRRPRRRRAAEQVMNSRRSIAECIRSLSIQDPQSMISMVKVRQEASERIYNRPATPRSVRLEPASSAHLKPQQRLGQSLRDPSA